MSRLRVHAFGISIDGYGAGRDQTLDNPMGVGGMALHQWVLGTKTFQKVAGDFAGSLIGDKVGRVGVDDDFAARGFDNLSLVDSHFGQCATITGRKPGRAA